MTALLLLFLAAAGAPPSPYIDKGACPFECCTYRRWQAREAIPVFDAPNGTRQLALLKPGEWVTAITGETHSIPTPITLRGERAWVLHYEGEGSWTVWIHGRIAHEELAIDQRRGPKTEWWARIRTASGLTGWVRADKKFDNQDSCA